MSTVAMPVPLEIDFWQAFVDQDYETAEELLKAALLGKEYQHSGEVYREGDMLSEHLPKYLTVNRATFMEDSADIEEIEFAPDGQSAKVYASYQAELYMGCKDIDRILDEREELIVTFEPKAHRAWLHVLEFPYEYNDE